MRAYLFFGLIALFFIAGCTGEEDTIKNSGSVDSCNLDSDCVPMPECHPMKCINKNFENDSTKPEFCTMMFAVDAAYNKEDCACVDKKCVNLNAEKCGSMSFGAAKQIALSSNCTQLKKTHFCNEGTGTWWIDLDIQKQGCSPACVINVVNNTAEINWRCTGLIPQ